MSVRIKGDQWCDRCQRPVVGVKATHRLRNSVAAAAAPVTGGVSAFGARVDPYVCANCGGPVRRIPEDPRVRAARRAADEERGRRMIAAGVPALKIAVAVFVVIAVVAVLASVL
jgi:hypothetical protein